MTKEETKIFVGATLDRKIVEHIKKKAEKENRSISNTVEQICKEYFKQ